MACQREPGYKITGSVPGTPDGMKVYLYNWNTPVDSGVVKGGKFVLTGKVDVPVRYQLWVDLSPDKNMEYEKDMRGSDIFVDNTDIRYETPSIDSLASRTKGIKGEVLLQLLEARLDNVVYRLGMAPTRATARQLVSHKHIIVDGKVVNIPSFSVKPGQIVGVREKAKSLEVIADALSGFNHSKYPWIEWDEASKSGKFLHLPERADIPENIKEQLIVELYSK